MSNLWILLAAYLAIIWAVLVFYLLPVVFSHPPSINKLFNSLPARGVIVLSSILNSSPALAIHDVLHYGGPAVDTGEVLAKLQEAQNALDIFRGTLETLTGVGK